MRPTPRALAAVLLVLAACAAHDKAGDRAAAVGDWKAAVMEYRQAVADKPDDPVLRQKFADAKAQALATGTAQARTCAAQANWSCALAEADFILQLDPANPEMAELKRAAGKSVALSQVAQAVDLTGRGQLKEAADLLGRAGQLSADPQVVAAIGQASRGWVRAAVPEADRLRAQRRYPEAIALLGAAAAYDASVRPRLDATQREYDAYRAAEHDRLVAEGEAALRASAWADAAARFKAAQQMRPDDRARALEQYATALLAGDQAVARADYAAATQAYQAAASLNVDASGYARAQLARVQIRPWAISIRSVFVQPLRPDGTPWVGPPSRAVMRAARALTEVLGSGSRTTLQIVLASIPPENLPAVGVEVTTPDGRRLGTEVRRQLQTDPNGTVIVATNAFDRRRMAFRVFIQDETRQETLGTFEASVAELVGKPSTAFQSPAVQEVVLTAAPVEGATAGTFSNLVPLDAAQPARTAPPARTPPPSPPRGAAR